MTATSRETAYGALFTLASNIQGVVTSTRRLKHWEDVPSEDCPAVFLEVGNESRTQQRGLDAKVVLNAHLWFYVKTDGSPAGPLVNGLLDALDAALAPNQITNVQTLGDKVHHCWIEGETQVFEGNLDDEAVAIVPILMLLT